MLLLLLEILLRKGEVTDSSLVTSILTEMVQLDIPRTVLLACEHIATVKELEHVLCADSKNVGDSVSTFTRNLAKRVSMEFSKVPLEQLDKPQCMSFFRRFGKVITSFSDCGFGHDDLAYFINSLIKLVTICCLSSTYRKGFLFERKKHNSFGEENGG